MRTFSRVKNGIGCSTALAVLLALALSASGDLITWTNSVGDWFEGGNWDLNRTPGNGDAVVLSAGAVVSLTNETPLLDSFQMNGGTLVLANWMTRLQATNVTVGGGSLTLAGPFTNGGMSNRVWVVCSNFTLVSNGTINVDSKGYMGGTNIIASGSTNTVAAQGPGFGTNQCGGGYGGRGGSTYSFAQTGMGATYGIPSSPSEPGSGGPRTATAGGHGGGAVRIDAGGTFACFGTITANGGNGLGSGDGGGSGGSIVIFCGEFSGSTNGLLRANGGAGNDTSGSGGGGRIAVNYAVSPAVNPGVRFSVTEGTKGSRGLPGQPGTLYLPDTALLTETLSRTQFIDTRLFLGVPAWTVTNLTASGCKLVFAGNDFSLNVINDLRVATAGRFGFGDPDSTGMMLRVGGNLIVTNGGTFYVYGGRTNGPVPDYGCLVSVTNDIILATNASKIYPVSHYTNGGSVLFRARNLTLAGGCAINGDGAGWVSGLGPGKGSGTGNASSGAGYGGKGGGGGAGSPSIAGGSVYGLTNAPTLPGSGGGIGNGFGTYGGGLVRMELSGKAQIDGTITVNGMAANGYYGAGSGGGILIYCHTLGGGTNGLLSAKGGDGGTRGGGGGGGRIAVAIGLSDRDCAKLLQNVPIADLTVATNTARFQGKALVDGGTITTNAVGAANGLPGTVVFLTAPSRTASQLMIR